MLLLSGSLLTQLFLLNGIFCLILHSSFFLYIKIQPRRALGSVPTPSWSINIFVSSFPEALEYWISDFWGLDSWHANPKASHGEIPIQWVWLHLVWERALKQVCPIPKLLLLLLTPPLRQLVWVFLLSLNWLVFGVLCCHRHNLDLSLLNPEDLSSSIINHLLVLTTF